MSLATRCPACSTVFRVVQDQLRVSEGWVRCGRCSEVFNAVDHMVDLPRPAAPARPVAPPPPAPPAPLPPPLPPPPPPAGVLADEPVYAGVDGLIASDHAQDPALGPWDAAMPDGGLVQDGFSDDDDRTRSYPAYRSEGSVTSPLSSDGTTTAGPSLVADRGLADDRVEAEQAGDVELERPASAEPTSVAEADAATAATGPAAEPSPTFLRDAERAERWRRPAVRRALIAGIVAGSLLLAMQIAVEYRDLVAARWVAMRPVLEQVCRWAGCRVESPRIVDALVVDSSGLVRVEGTNSYRFSVVLRNRSPLALAMPAIDLSLTDTLGRVIARRTLTAAELGVTSPTVAAAAELPMQATLAIAERPVAGYTIEVFYP